MKLFDYQEKALDFILNNSHCALWMECGLGKTAVTIKALEQLPKPALVIAPKRVVQHTWTEEIPKWSNLTYTLIAGTPTQRKEALKQKTDIYLINFELVTWLVENYKTTLPTLVIDESSRVKNRATKVFKALRNISTYWKHHIQLTGTPSPNGLIDLWSQLYLIDRGQRLGRTITAYRDRWFVAGYMGWSYTPRINAQADIESACSDVCLSLTADDYLSLPDMMVTDVPVDLSPDVMRKYRELQKELVVEIGDNEITAMTAATLLGKLTQYSSGAVYDELGNVVDIHSAKLDALDDVLDSNPIIVAYQYKHELARLRKRYPYAKEVRDSPNIINQWNNGEIQMLLLHPASAGHGLNLQHGGHRLVWFTPTWNLEHYIQTNARLHRTGQSMPVMVYRLLCSGTVDYRITSAVERKETVQQLLLQALK